MNMLNFNDDMKVNIKHIDEQHKTLVNTFNKLADAMKTKSGSDILGDILDELHKYANYHFSTEEELFKKYNYPDAAEHIDEHMYYTDKANKFIRNFKENKKLGLSVDVFNFMTDWIVKHIKKTDKEYSAFLNGKGEY